MHTSARLKIRGVIMKATGVVRKIDELGRIVIPKEIRRTLNINDGEEVEIFVDNDSIILKKFYRLLTLKELVQKYIERMEKYINCDLIITDREKIILSLKEQYKALVGENISKYIYDLINERKQVSESGKLLLTKDKFIESHYLVIPILANADSIGSIILISNELINDKNIFIAEIINVLIKIQLEN